MDVEYVSSGDEGQPTERTGDALGAARVGILFDNGWLNTHQSRMKSHKVKASIAGTVGFTVLVATVAAAVVTLAGDHAGALTHLTKDIPLSVIAPFAALSIVLVRYAFHQNRKRIRSKSDVATMLLRIQEAAQNIDRAALIAGVTDPAQREALEKTFSKMNFPEPEVEGDDPAEVEDEGGDERGYASAPEVLARAASPPPSEGVEGDTDAGDDLPPPSLVDDDSGTETGAATGDSSYWSDSEYVSSSSTEYSDYDPKLSESGDDPEVLRAWAEDRRAREQEESPTPSSDEG